MWSEYRQKLILINLFSNCIVCYAWINHQPSTSFFEATNARNSRRRTLRLYEALYYNKLDLNLLLIDHYDSFTFNLVDILAQFTTHPPTVVAADFATTWDDLMLRHGRLFDGVILSPGPGHPDDPLYALSRDCVRHNSDIPILGVCLGHQIMGTVYGAKVDVAPEPVHGQVRNIRVAHENISMTNRLWENVPVVENLIKATRYHSLHVFDLNGTNLISTAISDDASSIVMSMQHEHNPHFGLQFHPESIGTNETGKMLLHNFAKICSRHRQGLDSSVDATIPNTSVMDVSNMLSSMEHYRVYIHKVLNLPPNGANMRPLDVVSEILCDEPYHFWLDEARSIHDTNPGVSILGASERRVEYWGKEKSKEQQGILIWDDKSTMSYENRTMDIVTYLLEQHAKLTDYATMVKFDDGVSFESVNEDELIERLPFDFRGGHVGYCGYEVRHDIQRYHGMTDRAGSHPSNATITNDNSTVPTAAFVWADKSFVYDHRADEWYLVGVHSKSDENIAFENSTVFAWMKSMSIRLSTGLPTRLVPTPNIARSSTVGNANFPFFTSSRTHRTYNRNFAQCVDHIRLGESYELCLTNQLECRVPRLCVTSPFDLYKVLRRRNPAPFSAYFHWSPYLSHASLLLSQLKQISAVSICCTSPERFLSVKRRRNDVNMSPTLEVETKPIKGTIQRIVPSKDTEKLTQMEVVRDQKLADQLRSSVKDQAENLMIVDLLRNDLSQVCQTGSVHVSKLMDIESYATVHQMVSTVRGTLNNNKNAVDVLKACFPGGSMTGAPKVRTMELLHEIEERACRGPYSGCLGYISLNGCMDMNIIIRTAILTPEWTDVTMSSSTTGSELHDDWKISIGAGGAITALSQPTDEYNEMKLKASAVIGAVEEWVSMSGDVSKVVTHQADNYNETFGNNTATLSFAKL